MSRASLSIIQRMVYDNLGVTNVSSGYGNLKTNERYLSGYINDSIAKADIDTILFLFKNKQNQLLLDLKQTQAGIPTGTAISNNWVILDIIIDGSVGIEVDFGLFELLSSGGIFDIATYKKYFSKKDGVLNFIGTAATVNYIDVSHPSSLSALLSPTGFEGAVADLASSFLLMKRADKPDQSKFYLDRWLDFMKGFSIPDTNTQDLIND